MEERGNRGKKNHVRKLKRDTKSKREKAKRKNGRSRENFKSQQGPNFYLWAWGP